ncbi:helix-turn-helix domain-containing protein [Enterococcus saccharolyticus]|uniref:Helicase Helix-turn-helix domain-containing protein n=1 Tax=Candidatus Enterococcus willemsii TaxID=1857215 RepID=A0ABQ6YVN9_9ENTE|nr:MULTISPECIES: helix-turn-helix domain-containing protein [Enterococcus]KAF1301081.1 hypothetical protein BAU17_09675 [Enterococcus sp. CU12B]MCD5001112.1 helix-turn-helix domain-containing protein [Enterococcus saccharolyticus]
MNTFILSLFTKEDKLKPSTLYQLLSGKRTSSVLCYAFFHDLFHLVGVLPELKEKELDVCLFELTKAGKLSEEHGLYALIGEECPERELLKEVDFFRFGRKADETWRSLQFIVQVSSYLNREETYIPLENSPFYTERARQLVHTYRDKLPEMIYQELLAIFSQLPSQQADLLAQTLTGYHQNGAVFFQVLPKEQQTPPWATVLVGRAMHHFFRILAKHPDFILYQFLRPILNQNRNQSMLFTRKLFQQGATFEEIMRTRRLRKGTIQDHLIEWALVDEQFPFETFISEWEQCQQLPEESWKYRYKELTERCEASFLDIRLYQIWRKKQS